MATYTEAGQAKGYTAGTPDTPGELIDPYAGFFQQFPGGKVDVPSGGNPTFYGPDGNVLYQSPSDPGKFFAAGSAPSDAVAARGATPSSSGFLGLSGSDIGQIGAMAGAAYGLGNFVLPTTPAAGVGAPASAPWMSNAPAGSVFAQGSTIPELGTSPALGLSPEAATALTQVGSLGITPEALNVGSVIPNAGAIPGVTSAPVIPGTNVPQINAPMGGGNATPSPVSPAGSGGGAGAPGATPPPGITPPPGSTTGGSFCAAFSAAISARPSSWTASSSSSRTTPSAWASSARPP